MSNNETWELSDGTKTWGSLAFDVEGRVTLRHNLAEYEARECPGFGLRDDQGRQVQFQPEDAALVLRRPDGCTRALSFDRTGDSTSMEIAAAVDPKALLRLYVLPAGLGGSSPIQLTLNFRRVGPGPNPIRRP